MSGYIAPPTQSGLNEVVGSLTVLASGPYTPSASPGWIDTLGVGQWGNGIWNVKSGKNPSGAAKGDGVTDDTVSIQAAITAANAAGGGVVYIPAGTYFLNTYTDPGGLTGTYVALRFGAGNGKIKLRGDGKSATILNGGSSNPAANMGFISPGSVGNPTNTYENNLTTYLLNSALKGSTSVTCTTAAQAGNFAVGDICLLRQGVVSRKNYEINVINGVNVGTGVLNLRYALSKDMSGGTAVIGNVKSLTAQDIAIEDMTISSYWQTIVGSQIVGLRIRRLNLTQPVVNGGSNPFQLNFIRDLVIEDCDIFWQSSGVTTSVDPAGSSMDVRIHNNRITSNSAGVGCGEGAAHWTITNNRIYADDKIGTANGLAIGIGSASDILVANNIIYYNSSVASKPAIDDATGGSSVQVVIADNIIYQTGTVGNYVLKLNSPGTIAIGNSLYTSLGGIWITSAAEISAIGNTININSASTPDGILISVDHTSRVIGNTVLAVGTRGGAAVRVATDGVVTTSPTIIGNKLENFTDGIHISSMTNEPTIQIRGNQVINCSNPYVGVTGDTVAGSLQGDVTVAAGTNLGGLIVTGSQDNLGLSLQSTGTGAVNSSLLTTAGASGFGQGQLVLRAAGNAALQIDLATGKTSSRSQLYPGAEALGIQTTGGLLHSTGIPAAGNGNNNDWCISDNGHLYFKSAGAWAQKV